MRLALWLVLFVLSLDAEPPCIDHWPALADRLIATPVEAYPFHPARRRPEHLILAGEALRAWEAVSERYVKDGLVTGVSAGPGNRAYYNARPLGTETWGTGAYLMAGSEVHRR